MFHVALGGLPTLEFNELQIEQYLSQTNSFFNQGSSSFQVPIII